MIDGHCHLDTRLGPLDAAFEALHREACESGVDEIILLNIEEQGFSNEAVLDKAAEYDGFFHVFVGVDPARGNCGARLAKCKSVGAEGVKLHPRLHGYLVDSAQCISVLRQAGDLDLPVMIDCFPAGTNLALGNLPPAFGRAAAMAEDTRIAIGHAGGHHILDALMVAKAYENVFLDLSFSLLYYRGATVMQDIAYAMESIRYNKVFWGTDYPDRGYGETISMTLDTFEFLPGRTREVAEVVETMSANAREFLGGRAA